MHIRVGALFCQGRNEEVIRVGASTLSMVPLLPQIRSGSIHPSNRNAHITRYKLYNPKPTLLGGGPMPSVGGENGPGAWRDSATSLDTPKHRSPLDRSRGLLVCSSVPGFRVCRVSEGSVFTTQGVSTPRPG
jgi:hypothetical protein